MSYPSYSEYRDSGVEWIGAIPSHWKVSPLRGFAEHTPLAFIDGDWIESPFVTDEGVRLIQTGNIGIGEYKEKGFRYISEETFIQLKCTEVKPDDILICRLAEPVGRACKAPDFGVKAITSVDVCILKPNDRAVANFLVYALSCDQYLQFMDAVARGGTRQRVSRTFLGTVRLPTPPEVEQTQIARFLDYQTARIDALIAEQQRLIELLKEKRQAVISHAVTKGLDPDVAMKDSGVEWLGKVPEHWTTCKATYLGRFFGSEPIADNEIVSDGNVPVLKVASLSKDSIEVREWEWYAEPERENIYRPHSNFVAFPKRGAAIFINKVNVVRTKALLDPNLMGWKVSPDVCLDYMAYSLKCRDISDLADVSTVPQINNKHIAPEKFPCPPRDEQERISSFIDRRTYDFEELITTALKTVDLLEERRSALISAAVTGKIDVREWEPPVSETFPQSTASEEAPA
ncbi:restriction endonuclease subunit S [Halospina sp. K52047b]|uniref:restriction endonuclease subunit S n=1 Tax=Halospina sp. K52047b TaxID=2614160 RepID=UPI00178859B1|nr:restriction endonuclease subunit S [Halospina sp. K52047b]